MRKKKWSKKFRENKKDKELQKEIIARANYSLAILGMAFVRHGSGKFVWL